MPLVLVETTNARNLSTPRQSDQRTWRNRKTRKEAEMPDYEDLTLEEVVELQRIDDALGTTQYQEFPGRAMTRFFDDEGYGFEKGKPAAYSTTSTILQTESLKDYGDLRFGYQHPEMDAAYQAYLREKRRPRRIEAYAEDRNGMATKNRERNRKAYEDMKNDPEKLAAYRARKRAEREARKGDR
jgi:hypothetical protein